MRRMVISVLLAAVFVFTAFGQNSQKPTQKDEFFPIEQVKPGMRAIGYTVISGSEPKKFELEILGVLTSFPNAGQNAVLSKLLGDELYHTGVFQGMSGSPVYIDGKLLGAISFGYQFSKDPIAGITPIKEMIAVFEQHRNDKPGDKKADQPRPVSFSEISFNNDSREYKEFVEGLSGKSGAYAQAVASPGSAAVLMPIATPLAMTGVPPEVIARFAPLFQSWGFTPVAGVSGSAKITQLKKANAETLKPGSTIIVPLVRGDYSV
ncbi:MAG: SpoIVB peptidase S55 domain-containing protein, partial [Acidobacteriota bacterium]